MGLYHAQAVRVEAVKIATRIAVVGKKAGDTPPSLDDILTDARRLTDFYNNKEGS